MRLHIVLYLAFRSAVTRAKGDWWLQLEVKYSDFGTKLEVMRGRDILWDICFTKSGKVDGLLMCQKTSPCYSCFFHREKFLENILKEKRFIFRWLIHVKWIFNVKNSILWAFKKFGLQLFIYTLKVTKTWKKVNLCTWRLASLFIKKGTQFTKMRRQVSFWRLTFWLLLAFRNLFFISKESLLKCY